MTQKKKKKPAQQEELDGMPEREALGKKAIEYLEVKDREKEIKKELSGVAGDLVKLFIEEGLKTISVDGRTVRYRQAVEDKITVKNIG